MELAEKKRKELRAALAAGKVNDPITMMIVSIGVSVGSSALQYAMRPKQPMRQVGLMKGTVQIQGSQQGTFIPEVYGAPPTDITFEPGEATTWPTITPNGTYATAGANGSIKKTGGTDQTWDCGAVHGTTVGADDDAFIEACFDISSVFSACAIGFNTDNTPASGQTIGGCPNMEFAVVAGINENGVNQFNEKVLTRNFFVVCNGVRGTDLGAWYSGDVFRVEKRSGKYHLYRGFAEVASFSPPTPSASLYITWAGWRTGFGLQWAHVSVGAVGPAPSAASGGCKIPAGIVWALAPKKHSYVTSSGQGSKKHPEQKVENFYYTIDLRANYCRGPVDLIREYANNDILINNDPRLASASGVYDTNLNTQALVSGAGTTVANGIYIKSGTYGGKPYFLLTGHLPTATFIEAEDGTLNGTAAVFNAVFASGGQGVVGLGQNANNWVQFSVDIPEDGDYKLSFGYQSDSITWSYEIRVDSSLEATVSCPPSGPTAIAVQSTILSLTAGTRVIRFGNESGSCPNLDYIAIVQDEATDPSSYVIKWSDEGSGARWNIFGAAGAYLYKDSEALAVEYPWQVETWATETGGTAPVPEVINYNPNKAVTHTATAPPDAVNPDGTGNAQNSGAMVTTGGDTYSGPDTYSGVVQGGTSGFVVYNGTMTQEPDPTEEANVDGIYGEGSATAYRGKSGIMHATLNLQRWENLVPNFTAVWQHRLYKTLGPIFRSFMLRIVDQNGLPLLGEDDYDISGIEDVTVRGMLIDGRKFAPAEIIDNPEIQDCYNYFTTEGDGKMLFYVNGDEPSELSVTIPESEVGWLDGASDMPEIFPSVTTSYVDETKLARRVTLEYIDPGTNWEHSTQSTQRKVTLGNAENDITVQLTLNPDEARAATSRRMYRDYVAGDKIKFTLSWKYLYLYPGYKITIPTQSGLTYKLRLTNKTGGIGIQDCEGEFLEPASFVQNAIGELPPHYEPPRIIPAATVLAVCDMPTVNPADTNKFGLYFAGAPRNADSQTWVGWKLFIQRAGVYVELATFPSAAIMGKIVSTSNLSTDPTETDNVGTILVDLYGTKAALSTVSEADMIAGANLAIVGDIYVGFATAEKVANYPNRWTLSVLRNGQHFTEDHIADDHTGREFVLMSNAVQFIELDVHTELNLPLYFKAVSVGQSPSEAAAIMKVCSGNSLRVGAPTSFTGFFDEGDGDLLEEWAGTTPAAGFEIYELQHLDSDLTTILGKAKFIDPVKGRHLQEYLIWNPDSVSGGGTATILPDGGVALSTTGTVIDSYGSAEVVGGFLIEFQIPPSADYPAILMGLYPEDSYVYNPDDNFSWHTAGTFPNYTARPEYDFTDSPGPTINVTEGDRLGIYIRPDGQVEYHINYSPSAKPVWISAKSVQTTKLYKAGVVGGRIEKVSWLRQGPEYKYTKIQQLLDNGLPVTDPPPDTIYARVRQLSPFDSGQPSAWTYGTFVRP
jgi:hypothetical protein